MLSQLRRRVVVTGLGACTPLGSRVDLLWRNILQGKSGIKKLKRSDPAEDLIPCQVAGTVQRGSAPGEFNHEDYVSKSELRTMSSDSVLALGSAFQALKDANWLSHQRSEEQSLMTGIAMGNAGTSCMGDYVDVCLLIREGKYRKITPHLIPMLLPNIPAGYISIQHNLKGPNHCVSTACSTGLHSIGDSAHIIARGASDVMVAGSSDCSLNPIILAGFCRMKALSTKFNDEPLRASRPFDTKRDGFVPSEGSGAIILEELEHALKRGANIYAEILGYGMSGDAHHITAPSEDGGGAVRAMRAAMKDASIQTEDVCHVNAHATSTPLGDAVENKAIKEVFREHAHNLLVYAPKGALGHLLGAAGTVEAILTILSVKEGLVPPNLNLEERSKEFYLNYVTGEPVKWISTSNSRRIAVTNSFGFGGTNASICIGEYKE